MVAARALTGTFTPGVPVPQNKNSEFCAPLTSFDWNETDPKRLGTSSIDTTCTIWDIEVKGSVCLCSACPGNQLPALCCRPCCEDQ